MRSMLANQNLVDCELPEDSADEVQNLRTLVLEYKKRIRSLERELERTEQNYRRPQVLSEGRDPHPAWEHVASVTGPHVKRLITSDEECELSDREVLARWLLAIVYHPKTSEVSAEFFLPLSRMANCLMGKKFCDDWDRRYRIAGKGVIKSMINEIRSVM